MTQVKPDKQHFCFIFITMLALLGSVLPLPRTARPLPPGDPFLFMWNAPTELCQIRYGIPLDLSYFQFVSSTLKSAINQTITIFYTDRFGIFPHVDERTGKMYDEGLPQLVDLEEHTELAEKDIERYIPVNQPGLAVLDFEEWRPLWIRNWGSKNIYRQISMDIIKKNNKSLSNNEARDLAKIAFERAARRYFVQSIRIGKSMRPNRLWGYYLFPECYNYEYKKKMDGFTGACPTIEKSRNEELMWLWKESTALFPSIYLELELKDSYQARLFVRNRMQEAMRVSKLPDRSYSIPVYPYIRPVFKDYTTNYMSEVRQKTTLIG